MKMTLNELKEYVKVQALKLFNEYDEHAEYEGPVDQMGEKDIYQQQWREEEARRRGIREKTPIESIVKFFEHFKIDVGKLNPEILRKMFVAWEDETNYEGVSDMEDQKNGSVSVELDGMYGKHWMSFKNHDEWRKYYEGHILKDARDEFYKLYKEYELEDKVKRGEFEKNDANKLGSNLSPDILNKLKGIK